MITEAVTLTLPKALAQEAKDAGLLTPEALERIVREALRARRLDRLDRARTMLAANPILPLTSEEIESEIDAYRAEQRRAAGS